METSPALAEGPTVTEEMKHAGAFVGAAYGHPKMFYPNGEMLAEIYAAMHAARPTADPGEYGELIAAVRVEANGWAMTKPNRAHKLHAAATALETQAATIARLREGLEAIGSGEAFREQRFAEDDDAEYFLRAQRHVQQLATATLSPNPTSP